MRRGHHSAISVKMFARGTVSKCMQTEWIVCEKRGIYSESIFA